MKKLFLALIAYTICYAIFADTTSTNDPVAETNSVHREVPVMFTTEAYDLEALRLVIQEANVVAKQLNLEEGLPITESNIRYYHITPFGMTRITKTLGNITTSNYVYYVSVGNKFNDLECTRDERDLPRWCEKHAVVVKDSDTNDVIRLATNWLSKTSMDVSALNSECNLHIQRVHYRGMSYGTNAVPLYFVYWTRGGEGHGSIASVEVFIPTQTLMGLRVRDSKYRFLDVCCG